MNIMPEKIYISEAINEMTEEMKIIFMDLSARLPYGVKIVETNENGCPISDNEYTIVSANYEDGKFGYRKDGKIEYSGPEKIRAILRPLETMTKEEEIEFFTWCYVPDEAKTLDEKKFVIASNRYAIDFYNRHHFDYRGLIEQMLAVEKNKDIV